MALTAWTYPVGERITGSTKISETDNKIQTALDDMTTWVNGTDTYLNSGVIYEGNLQLTANQATFDAQLVIWQSEVDATAVLPMGTIIPIASNLAGAHIIPATGTVDSNGWMYCDGSIIPDGNSIVGTIPDLTSGRFLRGSTTSGSIGGSASVTLTTSELPSHTHNGSDHTHSTPNHSHTASTSTTGSHSHSYIPMKSSLTGAGGGNYGAGSFIGDTSSSTTGSAGSHAHTVTVNSGGASNTGSAGAGVTSATGSGTAFAIVPEYVDAQYIIKVA